jgi:hypothetical protein
MVFGAELAPALHLHRNYAFGRAYSLRDTADPQGLVGSTYARIEFDGTIFFCQMTRKWKIGIRLLVGAFVPYGIAASHVSRYNWTPLDCPVQLHKGEIQTPEFTSEVAGTYILFLEIQPRRVEFQRQECLTQHGKSENSGRIDPRLGRLRYRNTRHIRAWGGSGDHWGGVRIPARRTESKFA